MKIFTSLESWPIQDAFTISRGAKTTADVVVGTIRDEKYQGKGECVPYKRFGESIDSVIAEIESVRGGIEKGVTRDVSQKLLPAGATRNMLDSALWDLECKQRGKTIWEIVGITSKPLSTAFTIVLDTPEVMAERAREAAKTFSILKLKLGAEGDEERVRKVREVAPHTRLVVDVNEGWNKENVETMIRACEKARVELIEQPLPVQHSDVLKNVRTSILICADESVHTSADIEKVASTYQAVNIKLDKAGGLTEALLMAKKAKEAGLKIMVGCHVSTSLSMAPATVVAQMADYVDLDGGLLLVRDREPRLKYEGEMIHPTTPEVWG